MKAQAVGIKRSVRSAIAVFALAIPALVLVGLAETSAPEQQSILLSVELPDTPTAGARLFAQKACIRCHSLGGHETRVGPDLGRIVFSGTVLDLAGTFWNHSPVMREKMRDLKVQAPTMTSREMADLIAFLGAYRYYLSEVGQPGSPEAGRTVFTSKGCGGCHASDESAWGKLGPSLQRYRGRFSAIFLAQAMWNHGPEMASVMRRSGVPWPKFTGREMGDLIAYVQAGGSATVERVYFDPGSPRRGRDLFADKSCNSCHAIAGKGGKGGPDLGTRPRELVRSVSEIAGLMWNHSQGMTAEFQRRGIARVTFSGQEMADIIAYLYFVNYANVRGVPARGAQLFVEKCSTCHTISGGRRVGPDLATAPRLDEPIAIITAMWNHAPTMEQELRSRGLPWPRFQLGETADLAAYLLTRRVPPVVKTTARE